MSEFQFDQHFIAVSHKDNRIVAEGKAEVVIFDYQTNKKTQIPQKLRDAILESEKLNNMLKTDSKL